MILVQCFLKLYSTHTGKPLVGISPIGLKLMFSEYILGQYLTPISDVISWVEEEHEIMSDTGFFNGIQDAGGPRKPPISFSPVTSRNVEISSQNFLTFNSDSFATLF